MRTHCKKTVYLCIKIICTRLYGAKMLVLITKKPVIFVKLGSTLSLRLPFDKPFVLNMTWKLLFLMLYVSPVNSHFVFMNILSLLKMVKVRFLQYSDL